MDTEGVNKMKLLAIMVVVLLLASSASRAQVVMPQREGAAEMHQSVFGLGFAFGPASGLGLSFRHHLPTTISYQINGGIIKVDDRMSYSVGAEFQADLSRNNVVRFFAAAGCSYFYTGKTSHNEMEGPGRIGVGLGGEFHAGSGVHTTLEILFTYFNDGTVLPLPQLGFHYYFR
jgi:opacity protein-like surface antigen